MRRNATILGVVIAVAVVAVQALLIPLFAAPAANLAPRDLPIAVAGPPALAAQLAAAHPGAFDIRTVADPDTAIKNREVYGAIVLTPTGPEVHVASAASPTVATLLTQAAAGFAQPTAGQPAAGQPTAGQPTAGQPTAGQPTAGQPTAGQPTAGQPTAGQPTAGQPTAGQPTAGQPTAGQPTAGQPAAGAGQSVPVRDIVPVTADDPRGAGFGAGFLPLAITSLLAGVLTFLLVRGRAARLLALGTFAVLAGLAGAAVQNAWLGVVPGDYLAAAGVLGLFALAMSAGVAGLGALLGRPGAALGALTFFLVGNALSAVNAAPELLPQPWGEVGQWLPIGAGATLLRSVAYFDGHGATAAVTVLTAYAIGGLILVLIGRPGRKPGPETPAEAERELAPAH